MAGDASLCRFLKQIAVKECQMAASEVRLIFRFKKLRRAEFVFLNLGISALRSSLPAIDVVELAVRELETYMLFNSGRGYALIEKGTMEMEASIMDGQQSHQWQKNSVGDKKRAYSSGDDGGVKNRGAVVSFHGDFSLWVLEGDEDLRVDHAGADGVNAPGDPPICFKWGFRFMSF